MSLGQEKKVAFRFHKWIKKKSVGLDFVFFFLIKKYNLFLLQSARFRILQSRLLAMAKSVGSVEKSERNYLCLSLSGPVRVDSSNLIFVSL